MTNELTDLTNIPAPTLTLDPVSDGEVAEASIVEVDPPAAPSLADSLSAEELAQVDAFAQQIDIANSQQVLTFGAGAQKKMASFSETALAKVRTQDLGEAGDLIAGVVTELKNFDVDDDDKGFFGLFKKSANKITSLKARYDTAEANVDKIAKTLEGHQVQLMKDAATLDKLYELNLTYFKELTMYLLAGRGARGRAGRTVRQGSGLRLHRGRRGGAETRRCVQPLREEAVGSGSVPHRGHADGAADPSRAEQRDAHDREDPDHAREHHSALEEPDGALAWHR